jgi:purine nucleoside permease
MLELCKIRARRSAFGPGLRAFATGAFATCAFAMLASLSVQAKAVAVKPIPVKVVVVTMYEIGKLTGDKPGEAQFWVERQKLDRVLPFPLGEYELRMNDVCC